MPSSLEHVASLMHAVYLGTGPADDIPTPRSSNVETFGVWLSMSETTLNLTIKTVSNEVHRVVVAASATGRELKEIVRQASSISTDRQRLIYKGRVLQEESELSSYNIEDGHTVHLAVRPENIQPSAPAAQRPLQGASQQPQQARGILSQAPRQTSASGDSITLNSTDDPNTMEHVRQNLLTLHTLLSTSEIPLMRGVHQATSTMLQPPSEPTTTAAGDSTSNGRQFFVGQWIDVKDTVNQWLEATIMDINHAERTIFVHYNGW
jgi:uncharacterized ubiquitin-like protein YukD